MNVYIIFLTLFYLNLFLLKKKIQVLEQFLKINIILKKKIFKIRICVFFIFE